MSSILLISGSTRAGSTNTAALRTAAAVAPAGVAASLFVGLADLPHFNLDHDIEPLPSAVVGLRRRIGAADAVLFSTPEYAGALPGSFKNLLDWTVGGIEMNDKPVAWLDVAGPGRGIRANESLAVVLGYLGSDVVEAACRSVPVLHADVGADGLVSNPFAVQAIREVVEEIDRHVAARPGSGNAHGVGGLADRP